MGHFRFVCPYILGRIHGKGIWSNITYFQLHMHLACNLLHSMYFITLSSNKHFNQRIRNCSKSMPTVRCRLTSFYRKKWRTHRIRICSVRIQLTVGKGILGAKSSSIHLASHGLPPGLPLLCAHGTTGGERRTCQAAALLLLPLPLQ